MNYRTKIGYIKSAVRIIGYVLILMAPVTAIAVLIASELLGIVEEL